MTPDKSGNYNRKRIYITKWLMEKDLVCGMEINPETAKATAEYKSITYCFCSQHCKEEFEKNPDKYLKKETFVSRFIDWLGKGNEGKKLSCHKG